MNDNLILEPVETPLEGIAPTYPIEPPVEGETFLEPIEPPANSGDTAIPEQPSTGGTVPPKEDIVYPAYDNLIVEVEVTSASAICVHDDRPFLTTPIDSYNVVEGFLLFICFLLAFNIVLRAVK